ncbi:MAG: GAF domain-containing protein [Desulfobacteraceae bacterium]|nr:MAG: GAF domain-containing protein [Desulfobacteraceae bacterium]
MPINKNYISVKFSESELRERNEELSILLEMSNLMSTSINLKDLLAGALSKVLEYFGLTAGRIYLMDDSGQYLYLAALQGMKPEGLEKVRIDEGFSGKSVRTKSFIGQHVSQLEDKKRAALFLSKGIKGIICVPLITMDKAVGVMNLATSKMIDLDQNKIDLLTAIGNQIAVAANNARLYEELKDKIDMVKEKKEMIKFFSYSISHDLKSPASGIYGLTKRLEEKHEDALDEKGRAYCEQLLKASKQMVDLVENINAYIVAKEAPLNFEKVNVKEITEAIRDEFSSVFEQRGIRWSAPENIPEIIADRLSLLRVFRNFVDNALKYGGEELVEIKVGYEENGEFHIFSFRDDGIGIKTGDMEKIFDMFQRNETSKGTTGSGLGLTIVKEVAERHGGQVWMDSNAKKGTAFYISISKDLGTNK